MAILARDKNLPNLLVCLQCYSGVIAPDSSCSTTEEQREAADYCDPIFTMYKVAEYAVSTLLCSPKREHIVAALSVRLSHFCPSICHAFVHSITLKALNLIKLDTLIESHASVSKTLSQVP